MMINKNIQVSVILFFTLFTVVGCSEKEQESKTTTSTTTEQQKKHQAEQQTQQPEKTVASNPEVNTKEEEVDLEHLIKETEKSQEQANKRGYEWSTTEPLIEQAHAAVKEGKREVAIKLFQEAKMQADLAVEQAIYADEHWQLLTPKQ